MSISVVCRCSKRIQVREEYAGKKVRCSGCQAIVAIPGPDVVAPVVPMSPVVGDDAKSRAAAVAPIGWLKGMAIASVVFGIVLSILFGGAGFIRSFLGGFRLDDPGASLVSAFDYRTRDLFLGGLVGGILAGPISFWAMRLIGFRFVFPALRTAAKDRDAEMLVAALEHPKQNVRQCAAMLLVELANAERSFAGIAIRGLFAFLKRVQGVETNRLLGTIRLLAPAAANIVAELSHALDDANPNVRAVACVLLAHAGPLGKSTLPKLKRLAKDPDAVISDAAKSAIDCIEHGTVPAG